MAGYRRSLGFAHPKTVTHSNTNRALSTKSNSDDAPKTLSSQTYQQVFWPFVIVT